MSSSDFPEGFLAYSSTYLENAWLSFFKDSSYPALKLALVLFIWHEVIFWTRYIPYFVCDKIPFFARFKIQKEKVVTDEMFWKCVKHISINQVVVQLPMMLAFHPAAIYLGMDFLKVPFPSWSTIAIQCTAFLIAEDAYQYFAHRLLHWGPLYKNVHKLHHEFSAPFGIAAEYAHTFETVFLGLGFFVGPLFWVYATSDLHVITVGMWLALRLIQTVDAHSGYDFPWSLHHYIPFWAGAEFHDYHHSAFVGNYASSFRWWDAIMGTSRKFGVWKRKKALAASQAEGQFQPPSFLAANKVE